MLYSAAYRSLGVLHLMYGVVLVMERTLIFGMILGILMVHWAIKMTRKQAILMDETERVGFGTQSLLEQWRDSYGNGDYDEDRYDDDVYKGASSSRASSYMR
ncbi:hypothetical protein Tco_0109638 [Tanacetum coccineum]